MSPKAIASWKDLEAEASTILEGINADSQLGLAAAANPMLALEELGYRIQASARVRIEARLRFGPKVAPRALKLVERMRDQLGHSINADDDDEVRGAVAELRLGLPTEDKGQVALNPPAGHARPSATPQHEALRSEVLESLKDAHPFIGTLLDYRRLAASAPRFAPRPTFDAIRLGELAVPLVRVTGRLKDRTVADGTAARARRQPDQADGDD